jgi:hypothetical protein
MNWLFNFIDERDGALRLAYWQRGKTVHVAPDLFRTRRDALRFLRNLPTG